jgi:hypothetical protein
LVENNNVRKNRFNAPSLDKTAIVVDENRLEDEIGEVKGKKENKQ